MAKTKVLAREQINNDIDGGESNDGHFLTTDGNTRMRANLDVNNNKVTNLAAPTANEDGARKLYVDDAVTAAIARYIAEEVPTGTINGSNDTFQLAYAPLTGSLSVYINGQLQTIDDGSGSDEDYSLSGSSNDYVVFKTHAIPETGDVVIVSYFRQ